jgi:hypothetical protein
MTRKPIPSRVPALLRRIYAPQPKAFIRAVNGIPIARLMKGRAEVPTKEKR